MKGKMYYRNKRKTVVGSEERKVNTQDEVVKMRTKQVTPLHIDVLGAVLHSGMVQKGTKPGGAMILLGNCESHLG